MTNWQYGRLVMEARGWAFYAPDLKFVRNVSRVAPDYIPACLSLFNELGSAGWELISDSEGYLFKRVLAQ